MIPFPDLDLMIAKFLGVEVEEYVLHIESLDYDIAEDIILGLFSTDSDIQEFYKNLSI